MSRTSTTLALAMATLLAMTGFVLLLIVALLQPPTGDLVALATFLSLSGGATVLLALAATRLGLPRWVRSLRARMVLVSALTAVLALVNVGFTSVLMFLSTHDLALLAGLLGFSLGMAIFIAFAFAEPTTRSLQGLAKAVRGMSSGSLETRAPVQSHDEVGELAIAFNAMAAQLQTSFERERDLEQARRELISSVSHDLRTPLASIRAMVESMTDGVVTDSETVAAIPAYHLDGGGEPEPAGQRPV